jgi:hypothetical protein
MHMLREYPLVKGAGVRRSPVILLRRPRKSHGRSFGPFLSVIADHSREAVSDPGWPIDGTSQSPNQNPISTDGAED